MLEAGDWRLGKRSVTGRWRRYGVMTLDRRLSPGSHSCCRNGRLLAGQKLVPNCFIGLHASFRIPTQTFCKKVKEGFVIAFQDLLQSLRRRLAAPSLGRDGESWFAKRVKEKLLARALLNQVLLWRSKDLHDTRQLLLLVFARKYGVSREQLSQ